MRCFTTSHGFIHPSFTIVAVAPAEHSGAAGWRRSAELGNHMHAQQAAARSYSYAPAAGAASTHLRQRAPAGGAPPCCRHTAAWRLRRRQSRARGWACSTHVARRRWSGDVLVRAAAMCLPLQEAHAVQLCDRVAAHRTSQLTAWAALTPRPVPWPSRRGTARPRPRAAAPCAAPSPRSSAAAGGWMGEQGMNKADGRLTSGRWVSTTRTAGHLLGAYMAYTALQSSAAVTPADSSTPSSRPFTVRNNPQTSPSCPVFPAPAAPGAPAPACAS